MSTQKKSDSIVQLLTDLLEKDPTMQKCSVKLNQQTVLFLNELLQKCPQDLEKFQELFAEITEDGKIDVHDVPQILSLLKTIYSMATKFKHIKVTVDDIIKMTQLILTQVAHIKGVNQKTINQILSIVETASDLLIMFGIDRHSVISSKFFK